MRQLLKKSPQLVALVQGARRARGKLGLALSKLRVPRSNGYLRSVYGVWLKDRWSDQTYRYCVLGEYGFFYANWLKEQEDCVLLDIGANVGLYSLLACRNPGIRAAYAFEPVAETYRYLVDNVERNGAERCHTFPVGISREATEVSIMTKQGHSGVATLRQTALAHTGYDSRTTVQVVGSEYLEDTVDTSGVGKIAVKLDVEGHEQVVLETLMRSALWPKVWNVFYEVDERVIDHGAVLARLQQEGFEVVHKDGSGFYYDLMVQRRLA